MSDTTWERWTWAELEDEPTLSQAQTIFWFQVQAPVQNGSKTYTLSGYGYVADYSNGPFEDDKPIEFEVTIQLEGEYFETVA